jgi:hypothetical protein
MAGEAESPVLFPCPGELAFIEQLGRGAAEATMPPIKLYLRDTVSNVDPLYGEADPLYGSPAADDAQTVDASGRAWLGPYTLRAVLEFQETGPGGTTPEPDERGHVIRVTATARIPRHQFRLAKMVDAPAEERIRLPFEGDVVGIFARDLADDLLARYGIDVEGVGPWYFGVMNASFGDQIGGSNYWVEQVLELEMLTDFDPARIVAQTETIAHTTQLEG